MIVYHVTKKEFIDKIMQVGLKRMYNAEYLYFTDKDGVKDVVKYWIKTNECVLEVDVPKSYFKTRVIAVYFGPDTYVLEWKTKRNIHPKYIKGVIC